MSGELRLKDPAAPRPLRKGGATNADERAAAKLIEGYPLPPPDSQTVQRIWRRVASAPELRAPAGWTRLLHVRLLGPGLALLFTVALGFVVLRFPARRASRAAPLVAAAPAPRAPPMAPPTVPRASMAEFAATQGPVFFSSPSQQWQPVSEGQPLAEGQSLKTDPSGRAVMDIPGVASILISAGTEAVLERLQGGTILRLSRGSVVARVSKRPPNEPFFILTRDFSVKVVGTLFRVDQDANDSTDVSVREGVVEATGADGRSWRVGAGQRWSSVSPEQLGTSAIADAVKTLLEDGLRRASRATLNRELAEIDASAGGAAAGDAADTGLLAGHAGARPRGVASTLRGAEHFRSLGEAPPAALPPPLIVAARDNAGAPNRDSQPSPPPTASPVGATYADGLALERAGRIQAAAAEFIEAQKSDPTHAEMALYALGRLRQRRLQDPQGALEAFGTYRARYPAGSLLPEVDLAVLEIEVAAGHPDRALAESGHFLASHPASERTSEVHLLRGDLLREHGECRPALAEYRQVDVAIFAEEALFETAYCQRKLGDAAAARGSLRQYQQRYPAGTHRDEVAKALDE